MTDILQGLGKRVSHCQIPAKAVTQMDNDSSCIDGCQRLFRVQL